MTVARTRRRTTTEQGYGWAWQQLRLRILQRDGGVCHWCGGPARSVDHVTPKADGGSDDPTNLVASCVPCNSARSMQWVLARRRRRRSPAADRVGVGWGYQPVDAGANAKRGVPVQPAHSNGGAFFKPSDVRLRSSGDHGRIQRRPAGSTPMRPATGVLAAMQADTGR
jgi:5-methylcytosine-specific restriction protein A